jgi:hypothetical protein
LPLYFRQGNVQSMPCLVILAHQPMHICLCRGRIDSSVWGLASRALL